MTTKTRDISSNDDLIDVRDVIARFEELTDEKEAGPLSDDDEAELTKLATMLDELKGYGGDEQWRGDWYPITLIRRSYFVEYCKDLVQDIGDLPKDLPGYLAIDWDETASNLEVDYSTVDFDGVEYLYR